MNKNEKSLIKHALMLYGLPYNDNIEVRYYISDLYIEFGDGNLIYSEVRWAAGGVHEVSRSTSSNVNINIRSFIDHWLRCCNVNEKITHVALRKCLYDTFDIAILCNDNCWYYVTVAPYRPADGWSIYNW